MSSLDRAFLFGEPQWVARPWSEYARTKSTSAREELIREYSPLVSFLVTQTQHLVSAGIDPEALAAAGMEGLAEAISTFDRSRHHKFGDHALRCVRRSLFEELSRRAMPWSAREREIVRAVEIAYGALEQRLNRPPTDDELAEEVGVSRAELESIFVGLGRVSLAALDSVMQVKGRGSTWLGLVAPLPDDEETLLQAFGTSDMKRAVADTIDALPERQKVLVILYYYEGFSLEEIGQVLGLSSRMINRLHSDAVHALRDRMAVRSDRWEPPKATRSEEGADAGYRKFAGVLRAGGLTRAGRRRDPSDRLPTVAAGTRSLGDLVIEERRADRLL